MQENFGAFYDWVKKREYSPRELLAHEITAYCPTRDELKAYAEKYREYFVYEEPLLLSPDKTIMYGYSAEGLMSLVIPDSVEIYDNLCMHSVEEEKEYDVVIGKGLKRIVEIGGAFGFHNVGFSVSNNSCFSEVDEMLYDKEEKILIAYPSGKFTGFYELAVDLEKCYIQLPMSTEKICREAFDMLLLPMTLVIPDSVKEIEEGAFIEEYDKGLYMSERDIKERKIILPKRFEHVIDITWKKDSYVRPDIMYYESR